MRPRVSVIVREKFKDFLLPDSIKQRLDSFADFDTVVTDNLSSPAEYAALFKELQGVITSWEIPRIEGRVLEQAEELRIISHAGGMVRFFLGEEIFTLKPDLVVCNASNVMAQPVAEYALASSLACLRHLWHFREWVARGENWEEYAPEMNISLLRKNSD